MRVIRNVKGNQYLVLHEYGSYSLLTIANSETNQFVVAYHILYENEDCYWSQGYYFDNIFDAVKFYKKFIIRQRGVQNV